PDGLAYVPSLRKLYVSNEDAGVDTVVDLGAAKVAATIQLGGEAGNTQYDADENRIYVAVQTLNQLVTIDPATDQIVGRYPLEGAEHDHGVYIDSPRKRAYVACEGNDTLLVVDLTTMKVIQKFGVGHVPDVLAFDPGISRLYVSSEGGTVSVFEAKDGGLTLLGASHLADNAHTVSVEPQTHRVYFPLKNVGGKPVLRIMQPA
ncbi:MAG: YncE family protein, partial [Cyanobacteria bacterium REEB65]|nr:YncE family protein [Cyanobacteria bacterium REEB65]